MFTLLDTSKFLAFFYKNIFLLFSFQVVLRREKEIKAAIFEIETKTKLRENRKTRLV